MVEIDSVTISALAALGMAGAGGFLIGFEREWSRRFEGQDAGFAGARTFSMVAIVGALCGLLGGPALAIAAFVLIGALTIAAYRIDAARPEGGLGGTTEMAIMATFLLGLAAAKGLYLVTAIGAVAIAFLLSLKQEISRIAGAMGEREAHATLRLLVVSVMVLPLLPDQGYGPYEALNPRGIWKMVVFISGLSFIGYWLTKWLGAEKGVLLTGVVGGMASSTATTISLATRAREAGGDASAFAAGVIIANVVMIVRVGVLFLVLAPSALPALAPILVTGGVVGVAMALLFWRAAKSRGGVAALDLGNPFELRPALAFAAILAVISLAAAWGADRFGEAGLYAIALISGLADVDAIALTAASDASAGKIVATTAASAALIAAASNIVAKGVMSFAIGGRALGLRVGVAFAAILAAGAVAYAL